MVDIEPDLNTVAPGSTANTTTAGAFTASLAAIRRDDFSTESDRAILLDWMSGNATGDLLLRAVAPDGWVVADKSGGAGPIRNDIAGPDRTHATRIIGSALSGFLNLERSGSFAHSLPPAEQSWPELIDALDFLLTHWHNRGTARQEATR